MLNRCAPEYFTNTLHDATFQTHTPCIKRHYKITKRPEKDEFSESVAEFMQRNKLKINIEAKSNCGSLQTPCTEFICKVSVNVKTLPT